MMQEHFYALYVSNGGVATTPLIVEFEVLPYPRVGEGPIPPPLFFFFCINMTAKDARAAIKNHFA